MSITNGYTSLNEYKQEFYDEGTGDTKDDAAIERWITVVSRAIDEICRQRFYTTAADETRYFTAEFPTYLRLPNRIVSITTLKTDNDNDRTYENTWTDGTDYDLLPFNATLDGEPYRWIELTPNGNYSFPTNIAKGVEIAGKFGWSSQPPMIAGACLMGTHRYMKRKVTPLGISAAAALGQLQVIVKQLKSDPDFMGLLSSYIVEF